MPPPFSPNAKPGLLQKLLSVIVGIAVLVLGLMFSVVLLAVLVVVGLAVWAWLWWRTHKLRRALREQPAPAAAADVATGGSTYEGEATVIETHERRVVIEQSDRR